MLKKRNQLPKLIVIVGQTASGKSNLAVKLAKKFNGEIVSADSRQVYKGLDIGSGKITKKEMQGVSHHMLSVVSPKRRFTVAQYKKRAEKIINDILRRGGFPILVGGTGFYIQAVVDDINIPLAPPNLALRKKLENKTALELFKQLKKLDPRRAHAIDPYNRRRLIRAIEIVKTLGRVPEFQNSVIASPNFHSLFLGIFISPSALRKNIKNRLRKRLKGGMITEVRKLHKNTISWKRLEELGLEYRYIAYYLQRKLTKQEMIKKLETEIWRYAKRQLTWFKRDKRIHWIRRRSDAEKFTKEFLRQ